MSDPFSHALLCLRFEIIKSLASRCPETPSARAEKVLFDALGVGAELPLGKPVTVTPDKPGEYEFTCQMQMYRGRLVMK